MDNQDSQIGFDLELDDAAYDNINAPQFLDFSQMDGKEDDSAEADRFFEMHKEEDDYFIPENFSQFFSPPTDSGTGNSINELEDRMPELELDNKENEPDEVSAVEKSIEYISIQPLSPQTNEKQDNGLGQGQTEKNNDENEKTEHQLKARVVPLKVFGGPVGIKRKNEIKVTQPKEFHFASDDRIRERQMKAAAAAPELPGFGTDEPKKKGPSSTTSSVRSLRPPTPKKIFHPPTPTKMQPFSFNERDKELQKKKELKLQELREKENKPFHFHANPLPSFAARELKKKGVEVTKVVPFKLRSDQRGALRQQAFKEKLEKEEQEMKNNKQFHANPPTVIYKQPFQPQLGILPLAEPLDIQLNSDKRAEERKMYDEYLKQREEEEEALRQEEEAQRLQREHEEELVMRKQLVHKAKPLKATRVFEVKRSDKPLTSPKSPAFAPMPTQRRKLDRQYRSNSELSTAL